jgi:hypothetical protein
MTSNNVKYIIYTLINLKNHDCDALVKIGANQWQEFSDNVQKMPKKYGNCRL